MRKQTRSFPLNILVAAIFPILLLCATLSRAQQGEGVTTQTLVAVDSKAPNLLTPANTTVKVENRTIPVKSVNRVLPAGAQLALLIDDGLRTSVGKELATLRSFVQSLPHGTEIFIGYMQNGRVVAAQNFTTDFAAAANAVRIPTGSPGSSASPYFCLSDFVKNWPAPDRESALPTQMGPNNAVPVHKARFVLMITNGVDPYNGSTSPLNQNSPYVDAATADAQRAGVPVYSIYYSDAGVRGATASFSGQSYLQQVADGTGGRAYYLGTGNPVSIAPFLAQFQKSVAETYVVAFEAPEDKKLVRIKLSTSMQGAKLRCASEVLPGVKVSATGQ